MVAAFLLGFFLGRNLQVDPYWPETEEVNRYLFHKFLTDALPSIMYNEIIVIS